MSGRCALFIGTGRPAKDADETVPMKAKQSVPILLLIVVALAAAFALFSRSHPPQRENVSAPPAQVKGGSLTPFTNPAHSVPPPSSSVKDTTAPAQKTITGDPLLDDLRTAYETSNLAIRIRIEDQLSKAWETNPPTAETLLHEIRDSQAPAEYRIYFAKALANRVKMQAYTEAEVAGILAELRSIIGNGSDTPAFKADLANILTSVDHSADAVKVIAPLLQTPEDAIAVKTVAALCRSTNSMAVQTVYEFAKTDDLLKTKPLALLAALGPLSTTTNDVVPIINRIIQQTADFRVFAGSVQCLMFAPSSKEILESIADAACASSRFPQNTQEIGSLCQNAMRRHVKYFKEHKEQLDSTAVIAIETLLRSEDGK